MKIAVDIDDVIADFVTAFIVFHNDHYGTSLTRGHFFSYSFSDVLEGTSEETKEKVGIFRHSEYFASIQPIEDAQSVLKKLSEKHTIVALTSRSPDIVEKTRNWLDKFFPEIFDEVHFSSNHWIDNGYTVTKADACRDLGIDVLIDDSIEYARTCAPHAKVLLFDQFWNREELPEGIERVRSWKEIEKILT